MYTLKISDGHFLNHTFPIKQASCADPEWWGGGGGGGGGGWGSRTGMSLDILNTCRSPRRLFQKKLQSHYSDFDNFSRKIGVKAHKLESWDCN